MSTYKERLEEQFNLEKAYIKEKGKDLTGVERDTLKSLLKWARNHGKLQEIACSDELRYEWAEKRTEQVEKTLTKLATKLNLGITFNGDPRGFTIKLHFPKTKAWNTWGGEETGYGIGV